MPTAAEIINGVMAEIESRVATVLEIDANSVYEDVAVYTGVDFGAFVSGQIDQIESMGPCNDKATLTVNIAFSIPDDDITPRRVQRVNTALALRAALTWAPGGNAIANAGLPMVTDMSVSAIAEKSRQGVVEGGLAWRCDIAIPKGSA